MSAVAQIATLVRILTKARAAGRTEVGALRSVAGTIDVPDDDPNLETADTYVRTLFAHSSRHPLLVREKKADIRKSSSGPRRG